MHTLGLRRVPRCAAITGYLATRPGAHQQSRLFKIAGITRAGVHTLRHTFATHMVRKRTNLRVIQEAFGHSSLQMTSRYVSLARELMDEQLETNAL